MLVRKWGSDGSIARGSGDWELLDEIKEFLSPERAGKNTTSNEKGKTSCIVQKNTYDAFLNSNLAGVLEEAGVQRVVVCGVMVSPWQIKSYR